MTHESGCTSPLPAGGPAGAGHQRHSRQSSLSQGPAEKVQFSTDDILLVLGDILEKSTGGLDTLPHNGAVLTLLAVSNCTHKESYIDICITTCIIPLVSSLGLALIWGLFL